MGLVRWAITRTPAAAVHQDADGAGQWYAAGLTGTGSTTLTVEDLGLGARPYFGAALAD